MRTKAPDLLPLFRSDLQARLLAVLVLDEGASMTTRQLRERTGAAPASLHRELGRLEGAGLITHDLIGRTKRYSAAVDSPLHDPLRELLQKTLGVEAELRRRLAETEGVRAAVIFGSWAEGHTTPESDIDLLVVGDIDRSQLLATARAVGRAAGREIDVTAYRPAEFAGRIAEGSGFLATVLRGALVPLIGDLEAER